MAVSKTLAVNTLDLDRDGTNDRLTFSVTQTTEQSFLVKTAVDYSKDGFGKANSEETKILPIDTIPNWQLGDLKFENNKLLLLGEDESQESLALNQLIKAAPKSASKVAVNQAQRDAQLAENAGLLIAMNTWDSSVIGGQGLGGEVSNYIGGLISAVGTQYGSGGLGTRGDGWGGGGTAEGIGGLGIRGTGLGGSGYGRGAGFYGLKGDSDSVIMGTVDHSLEDRVIKQHLAEIRYAYESVLSSNPDLKGKVVIRFTIAKDGTVSEATVRSSEWNHDEAGKNVAEKICDRFLRMKFSAPQGGGIKILSYPFEFPGE